MKFIFVVLSVFSSVAMAATTQDQIVGWASKFHQHYLDLSDPLPGHEASASGTTANGEKCRLGVYHENGYLEVHLSLDEQNRDVSIVTSESKLNKLSVDGGDLDVDSNEKSGRNTLKVEGESDGGIRQATGHSRAFPDGLTCFFRGTPTS